MMDMHKRMGDVVKQDKAVTLDVVHRLIEGLKKDFLSEQEKRLRMRGVYLGVFSRRCEGRRNIKAGIKRS